MYEPIELAGSTIRISGSVGGCIYPDQAADKHELPQRADLAMYHVKASGKHGWGWWRPGLADPRPSPSRRRHVIPE